jgi:hypothetical protein
MKNVALALLMALALPTPGAALETNDLLALVAMPLAVAAVADVADVPTRDLVSLVTALNRADVPPLQFVEVVRYAPVAIVDRTYDPPFVSYVNTRVDSGIVGEPLVVEIQERYRPYGVQQFDYAAPRLVVVENEPVLPRLVVDRLGLDPLALVAMPLAVAAVAELTNVPLGDLASLVVAMNRAHVPPTQFVELVRYSPVVLLDDGRRPEFIRYATTDLRDLERGAYALALAQQLRSYGADDLDVVRVADTVYVTDRQYLPAVVRNHPHGGPPGQIKKDLGLQTGAEVVHGTQPGRRGDEKRNLDAAPSDNRGRGNQSAASANEKPRGNSGGNQGRGNESKGNSGQGNPGKGKGKG